MLELSGRIQELHNEVNCMNDSKDFQDAESMRSGNSHDTSRSVSFPPYPIPGGMLSRSLRMPSRRDGPPSIWDIYHVDAISFILDFQYIYHVGCAINLRSITNSGLIPGGQIFSGKDRQ